MKLAVFASGTGSNFEAIFSAIQRGALQAEIVLVVCDKPSAKVADSARRKGVSTFVFAAKDYPSKEAYETTIAEHLESVGADWLVLAGYMRLIGKTLLDKYPGRILNIHPSLLPKYKGKDALGQALAQGDMLLGASVHYVDETLDGGTIIKQVSFSRTEGEIRTAIEQRLHHVEHELYLAVLQELSKEAQ